MDGFDASTGVVALAATNRPDVLDPALLRPGRFDRRVTIQAPDKEGREQILRVHARDVPLDDDVDLGGVAATTVGMVGADLATWSTRRHCSARIMVATGGRAAEEVVFHDETTGAESDIRQATQLARSMVGRLGMSEEIGFVSVLPQDGEDQRWQMAGFSQVSEGTRQRVETLAEELFRAETLDAPDAYAAAGIDRPAGRAMEREESASGVPRRDGSKCLMLSPAITPRITPRSPP